MTAVGTILVKNVDSEACTSICKYLAVYDGVEFLNIEGFNFFVSISDLHFFIISKVVYGQIVPKRGYYVKTII